MTCTQAVDRHPVYGDLAQAYYEVIDGVFDPKYPFGSDDDGEPVSLANVVELRIDEDHDPDDRLALIMAIEAEYNAAQNLESRWFQAYLDAYDKSGLKASPKAIEQAEPPRWLAELLAYTASRREGARAALDTVIRQMAAREVHEEAMKLRGQLISTEV